MQGYIQCPYCGVENLEGSNFCDQCGRPLGKTPPPPRVVHYKRDKRPRSDMARAHFREGKDRYRVGDYLQAAAEYEQAVELDPTHASYFCELARARLQLNQHETAFEAAERAAQLKPRYGYAFYLLGYIYYVQGQYQKALKEYRKAISLGEDGAAIRYHMGKAYEKMGQLAEAIKAYREAVAREPGYRYAEERLRALV